jgi:type IV pilus assembly protein PilC
MAFEDWFLERARTTGKVHNKLTIDDKLTFFQQLATLVSSGTPILQAVHICAQQSQSSRMRQILQEVAERVASGSSLHAALSNHTDAIEPSWVEVIGTGEVAGKMGFVLLELVSQIREARETRRKVIGALTYPIILIVVAIAAVTVMLWLVVPTFAGMFREMGAELPGITQFVVSASDFVVRYGIFVVIGLVGAGVAFRQYLKTDFGRRRVGAVGLATPLVGELMVQSAMYRFASNIGLLLKSGLPMLETLTALSGVFHSSPIYRDAIARARGRVAAGRSLADSLEDTRLFTSMMTNMVRVGEESGQLASVMQEIAPYYKEKMEGLIAKVTKLMEPVIIIGLGSTIAVLMLSIYMPMFDMAGKVH